MRSPEKWEFSDEIEFCIAIILDIYKICNMNFKNANRVENASPPKAHALQSVTVQGDDPDRRGSLLSSPFDDLNQKIIRLLQDDGRATYDVIGQELGVSGGTVRNRVARMREAGMLRIVAVVDPVARRLRDGMRCSASRPRPESRRTPWRGGSIR